MEARRHATGVITKFAKLALDKGPADPRPCRVVDFDRCCDRKYTREERTVRMTERRMPYTPLVLHATPKAFCEGAWLDRMLRKTWRDSLGA